MILSPALLRVDRTLGQPLHAQLAGRLATLMDAAVLAAGARLPATRRLAVALGVHRTTVVRAYGELRARGYLQSRPGSFFTVRHRWRAPATAVAVSPALPWRPPARIGRPRPAHRAEVISPVPRGPDDATVDFASHVPDPALAPLTELRRALRTLWSRGELAASAAYADPRGHAGLRDTIARRLVAHGIAVTADEVLLTDGAQHAFDLVLRVLRPPRGDVLVESPTYARFLALLHLHAARPVPVPMGDDGLDLDALRRAVRRRSASMLFTMPNFQNPTGVCTSAAHREAVLATCEAHGMAIIEDGFDEELKYAGPPVLPIKSIDAAGIVYYVGTLAKLAFPGLRIGWIAAPAPVVARLAAVRQATTLGGNVLAQSAAAQILERPEFDLYLRRLHRALRERRDAMIAALSAHLPEWVRWMPPAGGYTFWLSWPGNRAREADVCDRLARGGVSAMTGRGSFAVPSSRAHLRLSIAAEPAGRIDEGCARLGRVLHESARSLATRQASG